MAMHFFTVKRVDYERFLEESRRARDDLEAIMDSNDDRHIAAIFHKYEQYIEENFEPYAALRKSFYH